MQYGKTTIGQLVRWDGNPRPQATGDKRETLKASILDKGVLLPLIVRHKSGPKTGAKRIDEVVAGDTRRSIVQELFDAGQWPADREIPVIVRDELVGDDAAAIDVALSENIHVPMHPMDQFTAFMQMIDLGRTISEIATAYGVRPRTVEQRLSFAKLDERARALVKEGDRDLDWASAMTMATLDEQNEILGEIAEDPRRYLSVHDVRRRLEDELVPTSLALFDVSEVADALVRKDLFDDGGATYMKRSEFQPRQDKALEDLMHERTLEGWAKVSKVSEREFDRFRYVDGVLEKERAEVVFVRHASGAITEHAGLALRIEERLNRINDRDDEVGEAMFSQKAEKVRAESRPETRHDPVRVENKKTMRYIAVSRAMICQAALMSDPKLAMAVTVAGLIMSAAPKPVEGRLFGDLTEMDPGSPARIIVERRLDASRQIMTAAGIDPSQEYGMVINRLVRLDDQQMMTLLQVAVASRITTDMHRGDMLFDSVMAQDGATLATYWRPDRTYLETLSAEAIKTLASQILPDRAISKVTGSKPDMVEVIAQIVDDAHDGGMRLQQGERDRLTAWAPRSLGGSADDLDTMLSGEDDQNAGSEMFDGRDVGDIFGGDAEDEVELDEAA